MIHTADIVSIPSALLVHCTQVCIGDSRSGNSDSYYQNSAVLFFLPAFLLLNDENASGGHN